MGMVEDRERRGAERVVALSTQCSSITTIAGAKRLRDKANELALWATENCPQADVHNDAAALRITAERRAGGLMLALDRGPVGKGGDGGQSEYRRVLDELGIATWQAQIWQRLARVPIARLVERMRDDRRSGIKLAAKRLAEGGGVGIPAADRQKSLPLFFSRVDYGRISTAAKKLDMGIREFAAHAVMAVVMDYEEE